ncbi:MAG: PDGLE domain-containing protein [Candidatus Omnitrophica bacterium]|nr:PDGLE domain-containing protein [Candidatus Omnitrophota bacterium]
MKKRDVLFGLLTAMLLAVLFSPFASPWPDGLEKVAEDKGFLEKGEATPPITSPIPDYTWPGVDNDGLATAVAGAFGTLAVFVFALGSAWMLKRE